MNTNCEVSMKLEIAKKILLELLNVPNLLANAYAVLRDVQCSTDAILTILRKPPANRRGQIFILWNDGKGLSDGPCFWSWSFDIEERKVVQTGVVDFNIPTGAWLVAVDCSIYQIFVGNSLQDLGSGNQNGIPLRVVRLRDEVKTGNTIRFCIGG